MSKTKNFTETKEFFSFILWHKVLLPFATKFPSVLIFADETVKIFRVDLFLWALQKIVSRVLIFVESPKMRKMSKLYARKNLI